MCFANQLNPSKQSDSSEGVGQGVGGSFTIKHTVRN